MCLGVEVGVGVGVGCVWVVGGVQTLKLHHGMGRSNGATASRM